ncbi:ankyrin repeat domain-containing protein 11 isoform X3 [Ostrinia furnacalis]|uniref:ankyrin repeat domain-containing protein 11 isoform X3 n=1 Tax=Ostrinia furnacalis TaxID=93504 RepID=UPI00103FB5BA|nr:ankyrin repeat domain-containing protein 11 isoform X3 [Ostrinia furnacalis]
MGKSANSLQDEYFRARWYARRMSTSRSRDSSRIQVLAPMSERQQLALVMQISSREAQPAAPVPPSPPPVKKRSKHHRSERSGSSHHSSRSHGHSKKHGHHGRSHGDSARSSHSSRSRDDSGKKGGNASSHSDSSSKRSNMDGLAQGEHFDSKENSSQDKSSADSRDGKNSGGAQLSSGVVSSTQDESSGSSKKTYGDESQEAEAAEDEVSKRKKRKENDDKEPMAKPAPVARGGPGRVLTGSKPPGPASKTGVSQLGKGSSSQSSSKSSSSSKGLQSQGKGGGKVSTQGTHQGKSSGSKSSGQSSKQDRKSPVASPKPHGKDNTDDGDEPKSETAAPKVPPLKIVIPGGASNSGNRNEQEGDGGSGQRGGGKGRGSVSTLPYVIPCTSADAGQTSDSSDGICEEKRSGEGGKAGQRVLRSHRTNDGDKDKERASPHTGSDGRGGQSHSALNSNKSPTPSGSGQDADHSTGGGRSESNTSVELHPRKRKIKASKDSHSRDNSKNDASESSSASHNITHSNPYQMYLHIRKQIDKRQKGLFPVKPKPPKDFNKYLMNRCTYTLQSNVNPEPQIEIPINLPSQMVNEFTTQEKERTRLRIQHLVEKEKLVLAVEQEILRVHGRAERAVANQALPFSVCTMLRDNEVYNVLAPEQEEKRNAQRSRCNGRQINSWLQEVDDKWEKIKVGMLRRQHTEAETLHAVQMMGWEWKLKELGICDYKTTPKIDPTHVPQIHVSNFDLPA